MDVQSTSYSSNLPRGNRKEFELSGVIGNDKEKANGLRGNASIK